MTTEPHYDPSVTGRVPAVVPLHSRWPQRFAAKQRLLRRHRLRMLWPCYALDRFWYGGKAFADICEQLQARCPEAVYSQWGASYDSTLVHEICAAIEDIGGWPNDLFIPDDPFRLIIDSYMDIEDVEFWIWCHHHYGAVPADSSGWHSGRPTLGQVVKAIQTLAEGR